MPRALDKFWVRIAKERIGKKQLVSVSLRGTEGGAPWERHISALALLASGIKSANTEMWRSREGAFCKLAFWHFKHLVNRRRKTMVLAINASLGYESIQIVAPSEV